METQKPDIVAVLEHFKADCSRVKPYGRSQIACPFHEDRSPSGSVDVDQQRYRCFAGCEGGDGYDLIELYEPEVGSFRDAADWLRNHDIGSGDVEVREAAAGPGRPWRPPWAADEGD